ncbi:MAG: hypothetical protein ABSH20_10430 [Tepidisphaeraceae bacterium]|jgi:hypothetical protein
MTFQNEWAHPASPAVPFAEFENATPNAIDISGLMTARGTPSSTAGPARPG